MLKLDAARIAGRLRNLQADSETYAEAAAKDIRALLPPEQAAWAEQQATGLDSFHLLADLPDFQLPTTR